MTHAVTVSGTAARRRTSQDQTGNTVILLSAPYVAEVVEFQIDATVAPTSVTFVGPPGDRLTTSRLVGVNAIDGAPTGPVAR